SNRLLGQVYEAIGDRAEADNAFRRSLAVLDEIQSRPELAQTLLAYGRFLQGNNQLEDRAMIERALGLFEEMNATGWIKEARCALAVGGWVDQGAVRGAGPQNQSLVPSPTPRREKWKSAFESGISGSACNECPPQVDSRGSIRVSRTPGIGGTSPFGHGDV